MIKTAEIKTMKNMKVKFKAPSVTHRYRAIQNPGKATKTKTIKYKPPKITTVKQPKSTKINHSLSTKSKKLLEKVLDKNL